VIEIAESLRTHFGFSAFRPGQAEAIESLLAGRDTLVVMPTGSGKSLIYQLSALHLPGLTLVISPLIALMKDQVDSLADCNVPATFINSTLSRDEGARRLRQIADGDFRLLYVAPERLRSTSFLNALKGRTISLLAVDEAHCISHWGHDFRPDYLRIADFAQRVGRPVIAALTATATPQVQDDIVLQLGMEPCVRVVTGFNRPNLTFVVRYTIDQEAKLTVLGELMGALNGGAAIVYTGTRRDAEMTAEFIRDEVGIGAEYYHAGMWPERRTETQDAFMAGRLSVVAATNAFGMGIDRPDVRLIVHFSLPSTLEAYYQEAGRAGRDGKPAHAVLLYATEDRGLQEFFIENDAPPPDKRRQIYDLLRSSGNGETWTTVSDLSLETGLHETKVRVGLSDLEEAGVIQRLGDVGPRMMIGVGEWDDDRIDAIASGVIQRRRHKLSQLNRIVYYAESNDCRRRILLDYFGDEGPADAPRCCDNCLAQVPEAGETVPRSRSELSDEERVALAILDAVRRLRFPLGRARLAQMLRGSRSRELLSWGLDKHIYYGRLADLRQGQIRDLIDQLCQQGYFKAVGGDKPVLRLTPIGENAIKNRASISLHFVQPPSRSAPLAVTRGAQAGGTGSRRDGRTDCPDVRRRNDAGRDRGRARSEDAHGLRPSCGPGWRRKSAPLRGGAGRHRGADIRCHQAGRRCIVIISHQGVSA